MLASLNILGSGCTFEAVEELTAVSEGIHRKFREMFGLSGDGEQDEDPDVNLADCEAYHARRFNLVKHMHRLLEQRQVRMG